MSETNSNIHPLHQISKIKAYWLLFYEFALMATFVVGGGYAILIAADRLFVQKLKWMDEEELNEGIALFQAVPGLIASNIAVYIGYKTLGFLGALFAVIGIAVPSIITITIISLCYSNLPLDSKYLIGAFVGARSALSALFLVTITKLYKSSKIDGFFWVIGIICFFGVMSGVCNVAWFLLLGITAGIIYTYIRAILKIKSAKVG